MAVSTHKVAASDGSTANPVQVQGGTFIDGGSASASPAISNRLAKKTWWSLSDEKGDKRMQRLINSLSSKASADEISALLFDYKFERFGIRLFPYLIGWNRAKSP